MKKIKIGVEIECLYNSKIHDICSGSYHNGIDIDRMDGWKAGSDSSIHTRYMNPAFAIDSDWSGWASPVEIISKCYKTRTGLFKGLQIFKKYMSKNGRYELNKVLKFNDSVGSHVHFSVDGFVFEQKTVFNVYPKVREFFKKKMLESSIKSKKQILDHYGRDYSKIITPNNWKRDRTVEFNFQSERSGRGLEWRSPNMLNISTWNEFFKFWEIVYESLEYLYTCSKKWEDAWEDLMFDESAYELLLILKNSTGTINNLSIFKPGRDKVRYSYVDIEVSPVILERTIEIDTSINEDSENIQLNLGEED